MLCLINLIVVRRRAKLDIAVARLNNAKPAVPQIFAVCFYCQHPFTRKVLGPGNSAVSGKSAPNQTIKMMCCSKCKKPLPKCAVCCLPLECEGLTAAATTNAPENCVSTNIAAITWCQTCKHGGHSDHMHDWFSKHNECPVAQCTCKCKMIGK